jgi:2-(3-amino-3-carboxypropyl)histidine synthase
MKQLRYNAIQYASQHATMFGIILGTLGRQGNPAIVQRIQTIVRQHPKQYKSFVVLLSEITPQKLHLLSQSYCGSNSKDTLCWVQVACPRLSVDWGHSMSLDDNNKNDKNTAMTKHRPMVVLNPYELYVALEETDWCCDNNNKNTYPMDYYSNSGGPWTNYYDTNKQRHVT